MIFLTQAPSDIRIGKDGGIFVIALHLSEQLIGDRSVGF